MGEARPRFGVWAPVYGTWGAHHHPTDRPDSSYRRTRDLVVQAEAAGFSSVLLAQHVVNPSRPGHDVLETWTATAGLAEATQRIELIAAIKPLLAHPGVLAKQALGIDHISDGRLAINLISGWYRPEMAQLGIAMPDHDARYDLSREWLDIVRSLWEERTVTHPGPRYPLDGLRLHPGPTRPGGPLVYFGGESEPARRLAAEEADVFFINGRPLDQVVELVDDLRSRPRRRAPLGFGLSAFVIARPTSQEAEAEHARLLDLVARQDASSVREGADPDVAMMKVNRDVPRVGTNGGTSAGLVGSYAQVAERIDAFVAAGIELLMLQFQPLEAEVDRFAAEVAPLVGARVPAPT